MAKKGQAVQLQQEINTDEEWEKLLQKDGLIVIDIYSEWSGPCSAMLANLKKIKLELGGDNLQLALAKADTISCLERFRHKSEPTWMFISKGKMVNLMFGANAPKLIHIITEELKHEAAVKEGTAESRGREINELSDEEQIRFDKKKAIEDEALRIETEKQNEIIKERRTAVANVVLENITLTGVILVFPHAKDNVQATLADLWEPAELSVGGTEKPQIAKEILEELLYFAGYEFNEMDVEMLTTAPCLAYIVKPSNPDEFSGDIDQTVLKFVYGDSQCPPGSPDSPAQLLMGFVAVPKESTESQAALDAKNTSATGLEQSLAIPSFPSLLAIISPSGTTSKIKVMSRDEMKSRSEMVSGTSVESKDRPQSETNVDKPEELEEMIPITGLWAPPNAFTKATAIKLLFPKLYEPIALPEPIPIPPHVAIAFEAFKRKEVLDLTVEYPEEVMRFGFFTDDNAEEAKLIAKTLPKFEKAYLASTTHNERLVIQLSKKRSEALCAFSQLGPTFISHNAVEGERQCRLFFPENYDVPEEEEGEVKEIKKGKKGRKGRKGKEARPAQEAEAAEEEVAIDEAALEEELEGAAEGEGEDEMEGEEEEGEHDGDVPPSESAASESASGELPTGVEGADKATSPMPEESPAAEEG